MVVVLESRRAKTNVGLIKRDKKQAIFLVKVDSIHSCISYLTIRSRTEMRGL